MEILLKELLKCRCFLDSEILAGHEGIDRLVRTVTVMDSPDAYKYMKGGDLVVSTAYFLRDQPELQEEVVNNLYQSGAAVLGLKRRFTQGVLPESMKKIADKLGFPVISISDDFAYTDIYEFISYNLIARTTGEVKREDKVIQELNEISHTRGLQGILDCLNKWTGLPVLLCHEEHFLFSQGLSLPENFPQDPRGCRYQGCRCSELYESKAYSFRSDEIAYKWIEKELLSKGQVEGRLLLFEGERQYVKEDHMLLEVASKACVAEFKRLLNLIEIRRQYRSEFLKSFLSGKLSREEIVLQAKERNILLPSEGVVVIVEFSSANSEFQVQSSVGLLDKIITDVLGKHVLFGFVSSEQVAIYVNYSGVPYIELIELLYESMARAFPREEMCIGAGRPSGLYDDVPKSYQEAMMAISVGRCLDFSKQVYHFGDLGFYRLLKLPDVKAEMFRYYEDYLEPIHQLDYQGDERVSELLATLQSFVECRYNYRETARRLYVHPNTVRYRINLIEKACRINFDLFFDRLNMEIALKIHPLLENMKNSSKEEYPIEKETF